MRLRKTLRRRSLRRRVPIADLQNSSAWRSSILPVTARCRTIVLKDANDGAAVKVLRYQIGGPRRQLIRGAALLCVAHVTASLAAEVKIDEHTPCLTILNAFDAKDPAIIDFIESVFKRFDAQHADKGVRSVSTLLAVPIVRGYCEQHPTATIYDEALRAYRAIHPLLFPSGSGPAKVPPPSEGKPRFRQQ